MKFSFAIEFLKIHQQIDPNQSFNCIKMAINIGKCEIML